MQLRPALNAAIERLTAYHVPSPRMNAELLIMFTLGCDRAYLYGHPERQLAVDEVACYEDAISRRIAGVPAQYITGHQEFWGLDLIVSPAVLIPRPETEHVVEAVLELAKARGRDKRADHHRGHGVSQGASRGGEQNTGDTAEGPDLLRPVENRKPIRIIDIGTGSGAIALALAKELPTAEIHASDISAEALEVAKANAVRQELSSRIYFHQGDLLEGLAEIGDLKGHFDFVVSNPPYVGESEEDEVQLEVRKFEPRNAVFAGPTGLEVIERLIPQAEKALRQGGWLVFEISGAIADGVRELLSGWDEVSIRNDLQGIARVAVARARPSLAND